MATITIDMDKKCKRCGEKGATTQNGLCLKCINQAIKNGEYDHIIRPKKRVSDERTR